MEIRPTARSSDLVVQKIADETLVYDLKSHKAKCLNDTSATVWRLCDGTRSAMDISIELSAKFKTNVDESFVLLAFDSLQKEELLDISDSVAFSFDRVTRREVIKKVGFAAIVALPIVSSVVAPSAANAASFPGLGDPCHRGPDCDPLQLILGEPVNCNFGTHCKDQASKCCYCQNAGAACPTV